MILNIKDKKYNEIVKNIVRDKEVKKMANITHHGITRLEHSLKVSYKSYKIAKKLDFDYVAVARAGLLHDFYLDGDERSTKFKFLDTFIHPKKALETSTQNFNINKIEKNIIISHMFPIYPTIPTYKESLLVNFVDKGIGAYEMTIECYYKFKYRFNYLFILTILMIINE